MADSERKSKKDISCTSLELYEKKVLGVGSYGKVLKAKFGQLPCTAKLFHDALFHVDSSSREQQHKDMTKKLEQECKFLNSIKHPHLVQYLGIVKDSKSENLILLMELVDENLTKFLKRSNGSLPNCIQIKFGYNIALALAYLHSIDIIHRNLSSNNILVASGSVAKVTDYGIWRLVEVNPQATPSIQYPRTSVYMPPEALTTPSHHSRKLDCFSYGVLVIQIATKQVPNPGPSTTFLEDSRYPTGRVLALVPEVDRRRNHIDHIDPNHPLLPLALACLKDRESDRLSAEDLCERLAMLTEMEQTYLKSVDHIKNKMSALNKKQQTQDLSVPDLGAFQAKLGQLLQQINDKDDEIASQNELITKKEKIIEEKVTQIKAMEKIIQVKNESFAKLQQKWQTKDQDPEKQSLPVSDEKLKSNIPKKDAVRKNPSPLPPSPPTVWKTGQPAPKSFTAHRGSAVVDTHRAYFSLMRNIYSYTLSTNKWIELPECTQSCFGMAIVREHLVAIGGYISKKKTEGDATNTLVGLTQVKIWDDILPSMPTKRAGPAVIGTPTHLIVVGGKTSPPFVLEGGGLNTVEVLDLISLQWTTASSLPRLIDYPQIVSCGKTLYVSSINDSAIFTCSETELIHSANLDDKPNNSKTLPALPPKPISMNQMKGATQKLPLRLPPPRPPRITTESVWKRITDFHLSGGVTMIAMGNQMLAMGGHDHQHHPNGVISYYDKDTDSWRMISQLSTPRWGALAVVFPNKRLMVIGGHTSISESCDTTDIGKLNLQI